MVSHLGVRTDRTESGHRGGRSHPRRRGTPRGWRRLVEEVFRTDRLRRNTLFHRTGPRTPRDSSTEFASLQAKERRHYQPRYDWLKLIQNQDAGPKKCLLTQEHPKYFEDVQRPVTIDSLMGLPKMTLHGQSLKYAFASGSSTSVEVAWCQTSKFWPRVISTTLDERLKESKELSIYCILTKKPPSGSKARLRVLESRLC